MEIDFGELKNDVDLITKVTNFSNSIDKIEESLNKLIEQNVNAALLPKEDRVKLDIYFAYSINSLFWMYLKLQGQDPSKHGVKHELNRVKEVMVRDKAIFEKKTKRPVLDQGAAKRFIRHGLWTPKQNNENDKGSPSQPVNKRTKFN